MGGAKSAAQVWLICAVCYQDEKLCKIVCEQLAEKWGRLRSQTVPFPFTHTDYYRAEMGANLFKLYCAFSLPIDPMQIVDIKLATNRIEAESACAGRRRINLDPGYLEAAKLVLATTKNYSHRIYLGKGIYGDVQLFWRNGRFQSNPWTYPDYQDVISMGFFTQLRKEYLLNKGIE